MSTPIKLSYSSTISPSNPNEDGVLLIGRHEHLLTLTKNKNIDHLSCKFGNAFDDKVS